MSFPGTKTQKLRIKKNFSRTQICKFGVFSEECSDKILSDKNREKEEFLEHTQRCFTYWFDIPHLILKLNEKKTN